MDENEYKEVYHSVNKQRCAFEKATLTRRFACENVIKINIAEREATGCTDPGAQQQCTQLLELLRQNSAFVLKIPHISGPLPHAKEMKVQCGGLIGLQTVLHECPSDMFLVNNIYELVKDAEEQFNGMSNLPFQDIVKSIATFEGRRKRKKD